MTKAEPTKDQVVADLEAGYALFQECAFIQPSSVFYWALDGLFRYVANTTNNATRLSPTVHAGRGKVLFTDSGPMYALKTTWFFVGVPSDLTVIDDWFSLIPHATTQRTGLPGKASSKGSKVAATMTLDLNEWSSLTRWILWDRLYCGLVDADTSAHQKKQKLREATQLLSYIAPTVTLDCLKIAASLGVIDEHCETFATWFMTQGAVMAVASRALPANVAGI